MSICKTFLAYVLFTLFLIAPLLVRADPPDWAPAHGYRDQDRGHDDRDDDDRDRHHEHERDRDHREHESRRAVTREDIGIVAGTCNREAIGIALGGVVGGAVGSKVGQDQGNQKVGLVIGAIIGAAIGQSIGREMDDADKQCAVQVLEQARNGQTVMWTNEQLGATYRLVPLKTYQREGRTCRQYRSVVAMGERREQRTKVACRVANGTWRVE